jgi:hypothetical protein
MDEWAELGQTELGSRLKESRQRVDGVSAAASPVTHFFANPVSGLPRIAAALSPTNAIGLAFAFYLAAVSFVVLAIILSEIVHKSQVFAFFQRIANAPDRFEIIAKLLALTLLPFVSLWLSIALLRLITRSWGNFACDALIAAAVLFSTSIFAPPMVLAWGASFETVLFLLYLNGTLNVLQLYAAFSQTLKLPDLGCLFAIPSVLFLDFWLSVTMVKLMFRFEQPWVMQPWLVWW